MLLGVRIVRHHKKGTQWTDIKHNATTQSHFVSIRLPDGSNLNYFNIFFFIYKKISKQNLLFIKINKSGF